MKIKLIKRYLDTHSTGYDYYDKIVAVRDFEISDWEELSQEELEELKRFVEYKNRYGSKELYEIIEQVSYKDIKINLQEFLNKEREAEEKRIKKRKAEEDKRKANEAKKQKQKEERERKQLEKLKKKFGET